MSTPWKSSLSSLGVGTWPVMHRMGSESAIAEYIPVIMSVPAGPDVPRHTPMLPTLARVYPSAMWDWASPCLARMWPIRPSAFSAEYRPLIAAPGIPKVTVTPSFARI